MSVPVIALTNASTCLSDAQVETVMPSLQRQVSGICADLDVDCSLTLFA